MKKKVYMVQPNYCYGNSAHFPYAAGTLIAAAWKNEKISKSYSMEKIFFLREDINTAISKINNPFLIGFSTYVWNFEYNKAFAKKIKDKFPRCIIAFGGHHVSPGGELLEEYEFIDVLIHGEGEAVFSQLLLALLDNLDLSSIPNISYRENNLTVNTPYQVVKNCDLPSPYAEGCFDNIIKEHKDLDFIAMLETSRGCPYGCAYCDWGGLIAGIRKFPMKRIWKDIQWISEHKIEGVGGADSNFGIYDRDQTIIDWLVDFKNKTGYPKKFQVSYAKNSTVKIFEMTKKLNDYDMSKGVTLSFQTMSKTVAENIGRTNIDITFFTKLLRLYNEANIPTYTELILGLPGETYESFVTGVNDLLKAGQHYSMYFHNCEWLPCSPMGRKTYMDKYGIEVSVIPLNQPHRKTLESNEIQEYSQIVTKTYSMDSNAWIEMNMFSFTVQCFHHMCLLQFFAIYLYSQQGIEYSEFYEMLLKFMNNNTGLICSRIFNSIRQKLMNVVAGKGELVYFDKKFGNVAWPFEEYAFLEIIYQKDGFYREIKEFLKGFNISDDILTDLMLYQINLMKIPNKSDTIFKISYNLHEFFSYEFIGKKGSLVKGKYSIVVKDNLKLKTWEDYARIVVWYGRKDSKNIYTESVTVMGDTYE